MPAIFYSIYFFGQSRLNVFQMVEVLFWNKTLHILISQFDLISYTGMTLGSQHNTVMMSKLKESCGCMKEDFQTSL